MIERTLIGIKPEAFTPLMPRDEASTLRIPLPEGEDFIQEVKDAFSHRDCVFMRERSYTLTYEIALDHYIEHATDRAKIECITAQLCRGRSHWMVFEGEDAIAKGREIIFGLREKYMLYPKRGYYNMTHAADSVVSAEREIEIHFP